VEESIDRRGADLAIIPLIPAADMRDNPFSAVTADLGAAQGA
jgi:hypothetical protein